LVIGFMIMFRQKLGSQTAVTAQQAIPGIVVALIVVTFSYAIAGFLIDLMYLLMYLMIGLFNPPGGTEQLNKNFLQFGIDLVVGSNGAFSTVNDTVQSFSEAVLGSGAPSAIVGLIGGLTMALIVSVAILIGVFKIFFELLKSYVSIIISIATAPLMLMFGAIPGRNNFGSWIRILIGNLMAFPTVLFALILYEMFTQHDLSAGGFLPPYLVGRGAGGAILALVGIGIVLIIPELIKEIKKIMGADGGIWEQLAGAAWKQTQEGMPLALKGAGAAVGAGGGLLRGAYQGFRNVEGQKFLPALGKIFSYTARGVGDGISYGTKAGGAVATQMGGKSPQFIAPLESAVDYSANYVSKKQMIERAKARQLKAKREAAHASTNDEWQREIEAAGVQADKEYDVHG
jgi:hypothetical protein